MRQLELFRPTWCMHDRRAPLFRDRVVEVSGRFLRRRGDTALRLVSADRCLDCGRSPVFFRMVRP